MDDDMPNTNQQKRNGPSKFLIDLNKRDLENFFNLDKKVKSTVSVVALALILFIGISYTLPFKDKVFQLLYPKTPSSASEDLSKWKSYTSTSFNFTFKYPNDFKADYDETGVILYSPDSRIDQNKELISGTALTLVIIRNAKQIDEEEKIISPSQNSRNDATNEDKALIPAGLELPKNTSANAYRRLNKNNILESVVNIFVDSKEGKMDIHFSCISPGRMGACESLLPKILSTFKFTQ